LSAGSVLSPCDEGGEGPDRQVKLRSHAKTLPLVRR
jgi:hypothetical protein